MSEMVRKVAEPMARDTTSEGAFDCGDNKAGWEILARVAISHMRNPNHAMCVAGDPDRFATGDSEAIWDTMIDAALLP